MALFFVSCPLDYEQELESELKSFWFEMIDLDGLPTRSQVPELTFMRGGVQFNTDLHLGFQINFFSKIANRVLLRIEKFEARYYDQYEKSLSKVDLKKYFSQPQVSIKIEHHKSRLNNEKNITEATQNVFKKNKIILSDESENTLYIRIDKDVVTLSIDTSGEHLHKRGYASYRGDAPLRETLAAYLVRVLKRYVEIDENLSLIDPFSGSGTLLFEALSWNIPNLERKYSFLSLLNAPKLFKSETWKKNYRWLPTQNKAQCWAFDIDEKAVVNLTRNQSDFLNSFHLESIDLKVQNQDSRDLDLTEVKLKKSVWCICNPPYGIRMADDQAQEVLQNLEKSLDGLIFIHPSHWQLTFKKMSLAAQEDFRNQGLNLKLSIYTKKI